MVEVLDVLEVLEVLDVLEVLEVLAVLEVLDALEVLEVLQVVEGPDLLEVLEVLDLLARMAGPRCANALPPSCLKRPAHMHWAVGWVHLKPMQPAPPRRTSCNAAWASPFGRPAAHPECLSQH